MSLQSISRVAQIWHKLCLYLSSAFAQTEHFSATCVADVMFDRIGVL
jgi:hypothetical protein